MRNTTNRFGALFTGSLIAAFTAAACSATDTATFTTATTGGGAQGGQSGVTTTGAGGNTATDNDGDGYTVADGDCNDGDKDVNPGAIEICDNKIDDNCNGAADESEPDQDGDGFGPCGGDCDDTDPKISPAATEVDGDMIDNNCDGVIDGDFDGDGYTVADGDCDDNDYDVNPGATENCFDGIDNDCNGFTDSQEPDNDMDGFGPCEGDCNDNDPNVGPNQPEIDGNGIDDNCDNLIDADIDGDGWTVQNGDCNDNDPNINPAAFEICDDMIDNDCDMAVDTDCLDKCELAALERSSVGCVYFAVDQDNFSNGQFAVVVSNVDTTDTATVQVLGKNGNNWTAVATQQVAPGTLHQFDLPNKTIDGTGKNVGGAYKIVSDVPVIAYEFNPITGQSSYTTDASLLLPTSALDKFHYMMTWKPQNGSPQMVIVASEDNTSVTIETTANIKAGGGIAAISQNSQQTFNGLNEGDYLQLEASATLNGSYITSTKPVAVFSAHDCANIPVNVVACDHLEEQLFGIQTWGKTYVAARMPVRDQQAMESTFWQIMASEDNTTVAFEANPVVTGLPAVSQILSKGQVLELFVSGNSQHPGDFIVKGDKPILVASYLTGRGAVPNVNQNDAGDPAMAQAVPVEQFLDNYVVLVPGSWVKDYLIITRSVGATVQIDGNPIPATSFKPVDDGMNPVVYEVARVTVADGVHKLTGSQPFGVVVLGYDFADSYAYPGGLDQKIINPKN